MVQRSISEVERSKGAGQVGLCKREVHPQTQAGGRTGTVCLEVVVRTYTDLQEVLISQLLKCKYLDDESRVELQISLNNVTRSKRW